MVHNRIGNRSLSYYGTPRSVLVGICAFGYNIPTNGGRISAR